MISGTVDPNLFSRMVTSNTPELISLGLFETLAVRSADTRPEHERIFAANAAANITRKFKLYKPKK